LGLAAAWAGGMECTEEGTLAWFEAQVQEVGVCGFAWAVASTHTRLL
jgi:hypothetical protein